ncbi:hypothetical protein ACQ4M4_15370 [Leptolyngbya sp. AN02str]|uniref:hypothetical protein n=1 Tax=Leptolyngbya sp. AN02str TaxID=3423363 RepID=UPI003D310C7F
MDTDHSLPPRGSTPVNETLSAQVGTSVLPDHTLQAMTPQQGTTILMPSALRVDEALHTQQSILPENLLPKMPSPSVSILRSSPDASYPPPQTHTSVLDPNLFPGTTPPKRPNLVKPMPKKG